MPALLLGLSLGIGAGVAPGPLLAVVIRSTLEGGFAAGARVAVGPLITDLPIIAVAAVLAAALPEEALAALGIAGGAFLVWLGVEALRDVPAPVEAAAGAPPVAGSLRRGAVVNLLNPHPWVFWITVGVPILGDGTVAQAALFLIPFYIMLVGSKLVVAAVLGAGRDRLLRGSGYRWALRGSGVLLLAAGVALAVEGIDQL
ncbi:MAG TPA: LysE family transporter [Baekduia sp.]|nr:LysE family transporter [Baekduia sp.]